jgi:hypothetical protein
MFVRLVTGPVFALTRFPVNGITTPVVESLISVSIEGPAVKPAGVATAEPGPPVVKLKLIESATAAVAKARTKTPSNPTFFMDPSP